MPCAGKMGDDAFLKLMTRLLRRQYHQDRDRAVVPGRGRRAFEFTEPGDGPAYLTTDIRGVSPRR